MPPGLPSRYLMTVSACPSGGWDPYCCRNHREGSGEAPLELGFGIDLLGAFCLGGCQPDPRGTVIPSASASHPCHPQGQTFSGALAKPSQGARISQKTPGLRDGSHTAT